MWEKVGQYGTDLDNIGSQDRMYFKLTCKNIYYIIHTFYITHKETQKKHLSLFVMHASFQ